MTKAARKELLDASKRVKRLEDDLVQARRELRAAVSVAYLAGMSYSEIARELGISRQRVTELAHAKG